MEMTSFPAKLRRSEIPQLHTNFREAFPLECPFYCLAKIPLSAFPSSEFVRFSTPYWTFADSSLHVA